MSMWRVVATGTHQGSPVELRFASSGQTPEIAKAKVYDTFDLGGIKNLSLTAHYLDNDEGEPWQIGGDIRAVRHK